MCCEPSWKKAVTWGDVVDVSMWDNFLPYCGASAVLFLSDRCVISFEYTKGIGDLLLILTTISTPLPITSTNRRLPNRSVCGAGTVDMRVAVAPL